MATENQTVLPKYVVKNALIGFKQKILFTGLCDSGFDEEFAERGARKGDEITVKKNPQYRVRVGSKRQPQNLKETSMKVKIGEQHGVDFEFSVREATFDIDHGTNAYAEKYIRPAAHVLAADKDAEGMKKAADGAGLTIIGDTSTVDNLYKGFTTAKAFLKKMLGTDDVTKRFAVVNSDIENLLADKVGNWFNAAADVTKAIKNSGMTNVGVGGLTWGTSDQAFVRTNGAGGKHVTGALTITPDYENEIQTITLNAAITGLKVGDTIEFDGVTGTGTGNFGASYFVNPETKAKYNTKLQRKVLGISASDAKVITVYAIRPAIIHDGTGNVDVTTENVDDTSVVTETVLNNLGVTREELRGRLAMANCNKLPVGGGTVLGVAGKDYVCCPVMTKDAVKHTGIHLYRPSKSVEMSEAIRVEGKFEIRFVEDYNIDDDQLPDRLDMLSEFTVMYPEHLVSVEVPLD